MKRTCVRQMPIVCAARSAPSGAGFIDVSHGTAITHAMTCPTSIAIPTDSPTRCPAPSSASDQAKS